MRDVGRMYPAADLLHLFLQMRKIGLQLRERQPRNGRVRRRRFTFEIDMQAGRDTVGALYKILDGLSEKKRTVFILHDVEGVAAADIGKLVGAPVLTVRTRLFYARREVYAAMASDPALDGIARELRLDPDAGGTR